MKEGLAALTKFVKVVMAYRPDRKNQPKPVKKQRTAPTVTGPRKGSRKNG